MQTLKPHFRFRSDWGGGEGVYTFNKISPFCHAKVKSMPSSFPFSDNSYFGLHCSLLYASKQVCFLLLSGSSSGAGWHLEVGE